jgi:asparagine synthase (glutamine-hydrolysing)
MCGIAGALTPKRGQLEYAYVANRMQMRLAHRGPDDRGLFTSEDRHCALAHTRLSILDLSPAGHQPMGLNEHGAVSKGRGARYWITYNGEIYNYRELRKELGAGSREHGAWSKEQGELTSDLRLLTSDCWQSNTDTEVILRAYARWGMDCLQKLRGMFAFAIWDAHKQELFLARDSLGIKPLYYYQTDGLFLFASEVRALLASGLLPRKLSQDGLASYLHFGSLQDPLTIVDGVQSFLPGQSLFVSFEGDRLQVERSKYARSNVPEPDRVPVTRREAVQVLRAKLEDSVRMHLISDVPLGAFLSGGIDSSAIVALMSRVADKKPETFSVVFSEKDYSEAEHARLVARTFGSQHHEILLTEGHLLQLLPTALEAMDQPTMDGVNTYVISQSVKEAGVTVALSGLGGDELFAGYPSFRRAVQLHRLATAPYALRQFASTAARNFLNDSSRRRKFWDMMESDCTPYAAYAISRQLFSAGEISALLGDVRPLTSYLSPPASSSPLRADPINAVSWYELTGYMANTLLRDTDQMSMAHALEVRVPFVDSEVINYVMALPGGWKINGVRPKPMLVDALRDLLPEEIWRRRKMGFTLPFQGWLRSALECEVKATLCGDANLSSIGLASNSARQIWESFKHSPQHEPWSRPWALYILKKWCDLNGVRL